MGIIENEFSYPVDTRFKCTRCAICCGNTTTRTRHILILTKEADTISERTRKPITTFARKAPRRTPYSYEIKKTEHGKCTFLQRDVCTIYAIRPLVCRFYPFELKPKKNEKYRFKATLECPGLGSGKLLDKSYFSKLVKLAVDRIGPEP